MKNDTFEEAVDDLGYDKELVKKIKMSIDAYVKQNPYLPMPFNVVFITTGIDIGLIKNVFFLLLTIGYFSAMFEPIHKACGKPLSKPVDAVREIEDNVGNYTCGVCNTSEIVYEDINIIMLFYKAGHKPSTKEFLDANIK